MHILKRASVLSPEKMKELNQFDIDSLIDTIKPGRLDVEDPEAPAAGATDEVTEVLNSVSSRGMER